MVQRTLQAVQERLMAEMTIPLYKAKHEQNSFMIPLDCSSVNGITS